MSVSSFPREFGYRMPAEWEPHAATWLAWPHNPETWPGKMEPIPAVWAEMIRALVPFEQVNLLVNDAVMEKTARELLSKSKVSPKNIIFHQIPTNDCWMRDAGPVFVTKEKNLALINSLFNKWGGKYPPWELDNEIPQKISQKFDIPSFETGIVLEGGSIDVNGCGSLLTTESCLLNKNRNPHLSQKEIEECLKNYLGVTNILWLGEGIVGDDTDGHVDDITRFVSPRALVTATEEDPNDENFKPLQENFKRLQKMKDEQGRPFEIISLPMPRPIVYEGQRLPASYANFYIANGVVLVPLYEGASDKKVIEVLQKVFPGRRIAGINAIDLIWGLGAFHCVTQQEPLI